MSFSFLDYFVVVVGAILAAVVGVGHRQSPVAAIFLAGMVLVATWLTVIDLREHRLPNRIVGPLAATATMGVLLAGVITGEFKRALIAIGAGLALAMALLILSVVGDLGMGDVKFGYPIGAVLGWFSWNALLLSVVITTTGGALVGLAVLAAGKGVSYRLSYGPYMALGLAVGLVYSASG